MTEEIIITWYEKDEDNKFSLKDIINIIFSYYQIDSETNTLINELNKIEKIDYSIIYNTNYNPIKDNSKYKYEFKTDINKILNITKDSYFKSCYFIKDNKIVNIFNYLDENKLFNKNNYTFLNELEIYHYKLKYSNDIIPKFINVAYIDDIVSFKEILKNYGDDVKYISNLDIDNLYDIFFDNITDSDPFNSYFYSALKNVWHHLIIRINLGEYKKFINQLINQTENINEKLKYISLLTENVKNIVKIINAPSD